MSATLEYERALLVSECTRIIAIDEVGRGALAGPVTVGAVLIGSHVADPPEGIDDSKKLTAKRRQEFCKHISSWVDGLNIAHVDAARIDEVGIMVALGEGASAAIDGIGTTNDDTTVVLLDGKFDFLTPVRPGFDVRMVVGGDGRCASIAAASIVAKEERDARMRDLHRLHPSYGWERNVGYGTSDHRDAIKRFGVSAQHRVSWRLSPG